MAFVRDYFGFGSLAWSGQAGETLIGVLGWDDTSPRDAAWVRDRIPAGWTVLDVQAGYSIKTLSSNQYYYVPDLTYWSHGAIVRRELAADESGVLGSTERGWHPRVWVGRFSGIKQFWGCVPTRVQYELASWAGMGGIGSGDVVHVAAMQTTVAPSGDTVHYSPGMLVATRTVTNVEAVPKYLSASTKRVDDWTWTLFLGTSRLVPTPIVVEPSQPSVDPASGVLIAWEPVPGQTERSVRRRTAGGAWQYLSGGSWVASSTWEASTASSVTAGSWTLGTTYELQVAVRIGEDRSQYSGAVTFTVASDPAAPTVSVSSWTVRRPTVTVSGSAGQGGTVSGYRIEIYGGDSAGELLESVDDPDGSWQPTRLPDGPVEVWAAVIQNGGQEGAWAHVAGTVSVPPVPTPTVAASAIVHPDSGLPGVRLTVTAPAGTWGVEVERDGVLIEFPEAMTGVQVFDDYVPGSSYRVRLVDLASDPREASPWVAVDTSTYLGDQAQWLIDPLRPERAVRLTARSDTVEYPMRTQVTETIDEVEVAVTSLPPLRMRGKTEAWALDRTELQAAELMLRSGNLLRYLWPPSSDGTPGRLDVFRVTSLEAPRFSAEANHDVWRLGWAWETQSS